MKNLFHRVRGFIMRRKFVSLLVLVGVLGGGYYAYGKLSTPAAETRYTLAAVSTGALVLSTTGSGQVAASNQVDVKPKVSADILSVAVKAGQKVKAGDVLAKLDSSDALQALRDAQTALETAELSLQELLAPPDTLTLLQSENSLAQARESKQSAEDTLASAYTDGLNAVANTFLDLPTMVAGLDNVLRGNIMNDTAITAGQNNADVYLNLIGDYRANATQFRDVAWTSYQTARTAYDANLIEYRSVSRLSDRDTIEALVNDTYETTKLMSDAVKNTKNFLDLVNEAVSSKGGRVPTLFTSHMNSVQSYISSANSRLSSLISITNTIKNSKSSIISAERSIAERTESLAKLKAGADVLDIRAQELAVQSKKNALRDAEESYAEHTVRAPFSGLVAAVAAKKGDAASPSTVLATLITEEQVAEIALNEVEIAKVKVGQSATLTFDAVSDLTIAGKVTEVDSIGTASQGVVSYSVVVAFSSQDDRVRPGMSVSASIITESKTDILLVPNAALKTQGDTSYVEVLSGISADAVAAAGVQGVLSSTAPTQVIVSVGLSNDSMTEVTSGLTAGDMVVTKTTVFGTAPGATGSATTRSSSIRIPGVGGGF
jgi:RND family efflux transporter MFP subunit